MYLDENSIIYPARDVQSKKTGSEVMVIRQDSGEFYTLDEVGSMLWEMIITKPIGLHWLVVAITERFDCNYPNALKDVIEFCKKMNKEKLLFAEQPVELKKVTKKTKAVKGTGNGKSKSKKK